MPHLALEYRSSAGSWSRSLTGGGTRVLLPLALAQFICSFAGSNMNVMTTDISKDLGTTVKGVQTAITLTPSVNVVQSSFPEERQGEISGLSRSVSNLGSSLGTAIAGTILVADLGSGHQAYGIAMGVLAVIGLFDLVVSIFLAADAGQQTAGGET